MHPPSIRRGVVMAAVALTVSALSVPTAASAAEPPGSVATAESAAPRGGQTRTTANPPTNVSLTPIDSKTYRVNGTPHCGLFESPCQIHVGNVGGDYHWNGGESTAVFANWRYGETKTPEFWTYGCTAFGCKDSSHVRGNPVTRPFPDQRITAGVVRKDDANRTVTVSGTAIGGAWIHHQDAHVATATTSDPGTWSATISGLAVGWNALVFDQRVGGTVKGQVLVSVEIAKPTEPDRIAGDSGTADLERGATSSVAASFTPRAAFATPTGTIEFTAPEGTTFATGQDRVRGQYRSGSSWADFGGDSLVDGVRSSDGRVYRYTLADRRWDIANGQQFRFPLQVRTPQDVSPTRSSLSAHLVGTIPGGTFDTTATVATTVTGEQLTARVTGVDQQARSATLEGTTPPSTTELEVTWSRDGQSATRQVQPTRPGAWEAAVDGLQYGANTVHVVARAGTTELGSTDVRVDVPRPGFTATARFDEDDVDVPVTIGGSGTNGARVDLYEGQNRLQSVDVRGGSWELSLAAPDRGGVRNLRAEQVQGGQVTDRADVAVDYGRAVRITSPGDGFLLSPAFPEVRISGRAAAGAVVRVTAQDDPGTELGRAVAGDDGKWTIRTPALEHRDQVLVATARSRGANTTTDSVSIVAER